ncbi:hypothetical protein [Bacillus sp. B15-48]|nr:hypothetical protein [Bacillus sp. B15-48]
MQSREQDKTESYIYNETGTSEVMQQILDSYNSGVIDSKVSEEQQNK